MADGILQTPDGTYEVNVRGSVVARGLTSHSEAWKIYDRAVGEVVSPSEKRADYGFQRSLDVAVKQPPMRRRPMTVAEIEAGRSPKGGWKAKQLRKWGVPWPPPKGWRKKLLRGEPIMRVNGGKENG